jgi:catechol 2,3-dioxygenase-like lactoylglutathione lyase family enzyme
VSRENNDPGLTHVALSVADFEAAVAHLQANGVAFEGEVKVSGEVKAHFFRDPEGNLLHVICRPRPL